VASALVPKVRIEEVREMEFVKACPRNQSANDKNQIKQGTVKLCGDIIASTHRHDFRSCKCGEIYVDGGRAYPRRLAQNFDNLEEFSEYDESEEESSPKDDAEDPT